MHFPSTFSMAAGLLAFVLSSAVGAQPVTHETLTIDGRKLILEKGTITVPEHRGHPDSRNLLLPYQRLLADHRHASVPPLFLLDGGPGSSNLSFSMVPKELWGTRDLVAVGYRGVDGNTVLPDKEFTTVLWNQDPVQSEASLRAIAVAYSKFVGLCRSQGIDINGYTPGEVVEDVESLRLWLGYPVVDLYGVSYGTRLTYLYGRDHASTARKLLMNGANPPGHFALSPADYDEVLARYSALYGRDLAPAVRQTTQNMSEWWLWWPIQRGLVKLGAPILLANPATASSFIAAYEKAAAGDASGLAGLSLVAPLMTSGLHAGDLMLKGYGDVDRRRDYLAETSDTGQFGRSFLRGTFGMAAFIPASDLPAYEPGPSAPIDTPTLVLGGTLDTQTPLRGVKADMMPLLRNGTLLELENYGHFNAVTDQSAAVARVMARFLDEGVVDRQAIPPGIVSLKPGLDLSLVAWGATALTTAVVAGIVALVVFWGA